MLTTYDVRLVMTTNPIRVNCDCGSYIVQINIYYRETFTVTSLLLKLSVFSRVLRFTQISVQIRIKNIVKKTFNFLIIR